MGSVNTVAHASYDGAVASNGAATTNGHVSSEKTEKTLLATVAHELRGPITALVTSTELLDRDFDLLDQRQVRVMISAIHRRTVWLRGLMENLLYAATLGDGKLVLQRRPLQIGELIAEMESVVRPLLDRKDQRLRVMAPRTLPIVWLDSRRVAQVFINLISNASKFSGNGTAIDVTATTRGGRVRVTVADQGPGVSPKDAERLFSAFYRGTAAKRTGADGLGIGLAVVKSIVEAHGGTVGVTNRRTGGAAFWIALPLDPPAESEERANVAGGTDADSDGDLAEIGRGIG